MTDVATRTLEFTDLDQARRLYGPHEQHLRVVEQRLEVRIGTRGGRVTVGGDPDRVDEAERLLERLYALAGTGYPLYPQDIEQAANLLSSRPDLALEEIFLDTVMVTARGRAVSPKGLAQKHYLDAMRTHDIVLGIGPAGTGKTYLAMAMAVSALQKREVARIVLCRPAVEAGERLGFLPGDLIDKVDPYLRPLYDALHEMIEDERFRDLTERGTIEVAPLAYMRGRTLNDAFVVLDEAQNTTSEQMKMFLTRLGFGSKAVITGDITQVDLPDSRRSGLVEASRVLQKVEGIEICYFTEVDVVRHPLVQRVIRAYEQHRQRQKSPRKPGRKRRG